ncbi:MAG: dienelactone hydrolase family protein [Solibacillus sp.]
MELKQNSNRCVILLHEIYGVNDHLQHYATFMYDHGFDVYVPNLLAKSTAYSYEEEDLAYENFMANVGFDRAQQQVNAFINQLAKKYQHIRIIGFSVGATIGWLCSENPFVHKVIGLYGSRIRQYTELTPRAEVRLFYGDKEKSFDPQQLKISLSKHANVVVTIVEGEHGFADPYSQKYNKCTTDGLVDYLV